MGRGALAGIHPWPLMHGCSCSVVRRRIAGQRMRREGASMVQVRARARGHRRRPGAGRRSGRSHTRPGRISRGTWGRILPSWRSPVAASVKAHAPRPLPDASVLGSVPTDAGAHTLSAKLPAPSDAASHSDPGRDESDGSTGLSREVRAKSLELEARTGPLRHVNTPCPRRLRPARPSVPPASMPSHRPRENSLGARLAARVLLPQPPPKRADPEAGAWQPWTSFQGLKLPKPHAAGFIHS